MKISKKLRNRCIEKISFKIKKLDYNFEKNYLRSPRSYGENLKLCSWRWETCRRIGREFGWALEKPGRFWIRLHAPTSSSNPTIQLLLAETLARYTCLTLTVFLGLAFWGSGRCERQKCRGATLTQIPRSDPPPKFNFIEISNCAQI